MSESLQTSALRPLRSGCPAARIIGHLLRSRGGASIRAGASRSRRAADLSRVSAWMRRVSIAVTVCRGRIDQLEHLSGLHRAG